MSNRRRIRSGPPVRRPTDIETARANAQVARQVADQAAADLARLEANQPRPATQEPTVAAPVVTANLDQLAARITAHRDNNAPHGAALAEYEQTLMAELQTAFPDLDLGQLGAVLLYAGARMAEVATTLPPEMRPNAAPIIVNILQLVGERFYLRQPPIIWECPYTLVGGAKCTKKLTAKDEEQLAPRVAGHLELSHPDTRDERRAS